MKKILSIALAAALSFGLVFAEEAESIGSPSFESKNTFTIKGESDKYGNFAPGKGENALEAKFAIGFDLNQMFSVTPFVYNEAVFSSDKIIANPILFGEDTFKLGLEFGISPMEMLSFNLNLGYLTKINNGVLREMPIGIHNLNGIFAGAALDLNMESFFLTAKLAYDLEANFGKNKTGDNEKDLIKVSEIQNTITAELGFDFFNFIKAGLNSGLVVTDELKIAGLTMKDMKAPDTPDKGSFLENDLGIGLHFNPVKYFDFTFLTKFGYEKKKMYDNTGKKWVDLEKTSTVGLSLASVFTHQNFSLEFEYNPTLKKKITDKDGKVTEFEKKEKEHEFKIAVGFAL